MSEADNQSPGSDPANNGPDQASARPETTGQHVPRYGAMLPESSQGPPPQQADGPWQQPQGYPGHPHSPYGPAAGTAEGPGHHQGPPMYAGPGYQAPAQGSPGAMGPGGAPAPGDKREIPYGYQPKGIFSRPGGDPKGRETKPTLPKGFPGKIFGQPDSEPGRFTFLDLIPTLPYLLIFIALPILTTVLMGSDGPEIQPGDIDWRLEFIVNAVLFGGFLVVIVPLSARALGRSFRVFTHHFLAWLKLVGIPLLWIAITILNIIVTFSLIMLFGEEPDTAANQQGIEQMLSAVPLWASLLVFGLVGPFVEEYFFRHLLVGKLSVHLNIWVCGAISVVIFAGIHISTELFTGNAQEIIMALAGYLTMSIVFTLAYILSGRSLVYVWLIHAFNNVVAVLMSYYVIPFLDDMEGAAALLSKLTMLG